MSVLLQLLGRHYVALVMYRPGIQVALAWSARLCQLGAHEEQAQQCPPSLVSFLPDRGTVQAWLQGVGGGQVPRSPVAVLWAMTLRWYLERVGGHWLSHESTVRHVR